MNYSPTVDYRSDRAPLSPEAPDEPRSWVTEVAIRAALSISLAVWVVVGFILWLPLLLRRTASFVVAVLSATLTNGSPDLAGKHLRDSASFYRRGFQTAFRSVLSSPTEGSDSGTSSDQSLAARPILQEIAWALVIWYPLLLMLGIAELTPVDVWSFLAGLPWAETTTDVLEAAGAVAERWAAALGL